MQQINCLNLCEILPYLQKKKSNLAEILKASKQLAGYATCERVYVGSSFCGKYFLEQSDATWKELVPLCEDENIKITLAVPTFSEGDLEKGKDKIARLVAIADNQMDEFTVNDFGMLSYLKEQFNQSINMGRLFMKDYRDPRYEEYFQIPWKPKVLTNYFKKLLEEYNVKSCEFDITHQSVNFAEMPDGVETGVHVPFCYQTVGRICEYASIQKDITQKFRPNAGCERDCAQNFVKYTVTDGNMEYVRFGRTVYFRHPGFELKGLERCRMIYLPMDLS